LRLLLQTQAAYPHLPREDCLSSNQTDISGIFQRAELGADLDRIPAEQRGGLPNSFVMVDLGHFKTFNDTYGQGVGDEVLMATAQGVATVIRGKGEAYRYGEEEISVILPNHAH
jgi:diguanylate cyclase